MTKQHHPFVEASIRTVSMAGAAAGATTHYIGATIVMLSPMGSKLPYNAFTTPSPMSRFGMACYDRACGNTRHPA